jgi:hypothetical protein
VACCCRHRSPRRPFCRRATELNVLLNPRHPDGALVQVVDTGHSSSIRGCSGPLALDRGGVGSAYLIQSGGPRALKTGNLTGSGVPTSIGAVSV